MILNTDDRLENIKANVDYDNSIQKWLGMKTDGNRR